MTHYLIEALTTSLHLADGNRDGAVSTWEAHDFARVRAMEHTGETQVPEAYFRMIGRAEIYLSGSVTDEQNSQGALVYAYGDDVGQQTNIEIDGRNKGSFPQTVSLEPGDHRVVIRDGSGRALADGHLSFAPGQVYSLDLLMQELKGYRRYFGLQSGAGYHLEGPADLFWGTWTPQFTVVSGYRVRGGWLRGLSLAFNVGLQTAVDGEWKGVIAEPEPWRPIWDGGVSLMMRRGTSSIQGGVGVFAEATLGGLPDGRPPFYELLPSRARQRPLFPFCTRYCRLGPSRLVALHHQN